MTTKFALTNYGPAGKELLVVLVNPQEAEHVVVRRHVVPGYQIHEVRLEDEQVLIVRPLVTSGRAPMPLFTPSQLKELSHVVEPDPGDHPGAAAGRRDPRLAP